MYESPITQITTEMQFTYENECMKIVQGCGFDVNKEELMKALAYDRGQYNKGYADAIDEFTEKITLGISESFIWDMLATANENSSLSDTSDKIVDYVIDEVKKIAERMKGGA